MKRTKTLLFLMCLLPIIALGQTFAQIQAEAAKGNALGYAWTLAEEYGPRIPGSPNYGRAADWAARTLADFGGRATIADAGLMGTGWSWDHALVTMYNPGMKVFQSLPYPWSPGTQGRIDASAVYLPFPHVSNAALEKATVEYSDKVSKANVRGKIILMDEPITPSIQPSSGNYDAKDLAELAQAQPACPPFVLGTPVPPASSKESNRCWFETAPFSEVTKLNQTNTNLRNRLFALYAKLGARAVVRTGRNAS